MNRLITFLRDALAGYEPAVVRSFLIAIFVLLASFGIGTGDLPAQVEALLTFATFAIPLIGGWLIRAKVMPVKAGESLLPPDPYGPEFVEDEGE